MGVTIKDVAKLAGTSISAVSYVLNNSTAKKYAPETIERIRAAAKQLNYTPSHIARGMRSQKAFALGVVNFWGFEQRVFIETFEGIEKAATDAGYAIVMCPFKEETPYSYLDFYARHWVDGLIVISPATWGGDWKEKEIGHINAMKKVGVPFVVINGNSHVPDVNYFYYNYFNTTSLAVDYLYALGHRKIAYAAPVAEMPGDALSERLNGYLAAAERHGIAPDVYDVVRMSDSALKNVDAFVTNQSDSARIILHRAIDLGMRVPRDFSLVAGNVLWFSEYLYTALTCTQIPFREIGIKAVKRVLESIRESGGFVIESPESIIHAGTSVRDLRNPEDCVNAAPESFRFDEII